MARKPVERRTPVTIRGVRLVRVEPPWLRGYRPVVRYEPADRQGGADAGRRV